LQTDPLKWTNLAGKPESEANFSDLKKLLADWHARTPDAPEQSDNPTRRQSDNPTRRQSDEERTLGEESRSQGNHRPGNQAARAARWLIIPPDI
jgi:hypothetical protein